MCCFFVLNGCSSKSYYDSLSVEDPNLSLFGNGKYYGEDTLNPPFGVFIAQSHVEVEVVIHDHAYEDIIVKTKTLKNFDHLKKIRQLIIDKQTLQIDGLAGATSLTGKAYRDNFELDFLA